MGLRAEAEAIAAQAAIRYELDTESPSDPFMIGTTARWAAMDKLCKLNHAKWLRLVCKYTPSLPQLLALACEEGTGPTTGLVMSQFLELAQSVTWEEIEQGETSCPNG